LLVGFVFLKAQYSRLRARQKGFPFAFGGFGPILVAALKVGGGSFILFAAARKKYAVSLSLQVARCILAHHRNFAPAGRT
jgi:hypothetical protein